MRNSFSKNLNEISYKSTNWDKILSEYIEAFYSLDDTENEEHERLIKELHDVLSEVLKFFIDYGKFRDQWTLPPRIWSGSLFGQQAVTRSQKLGADFNFGLDYDGFFLQTYIQYPWHLKSMEDDFWIEFAALFSLGDFKFVENTSPTVPEGKGAKNILKKTRSSVFGIIKNYILLELYDSESLIDLGWLEIKWPPNTNWETLIHKGSQAFKKLYRINYMLYRAEYLKRKRLNTLNVRFQNP